MNKAPEQGPFSPLVSCLLLALYFLFAAILFLAMMQGAWRWELG